MRDVARRLIASAKTDSGSCAKAAAHVFEALRDSLARLAGLEGFSSLGRRALSLAKAEHPSLQSATINPQGRLEGTENVDLNAAVEVVAQLLGLLETFIGGPLALRLVREACGDALLDE